MTLIAFDTSAAIPLLQASHAAHDDVVGAAAGMDVRLTGHSLAEVYSVLTRLPGDARLAPRDAVTVIDATFGRSLLLGDEQALAVPRLFASAGVAGGAAYDGLVALAALANNAELWTRDVRAVTTYQALGVPFRVAGR